MAQSATLMCVTERSEVKGAGCYCHSCYCGVTKPAGSKMPQPDRDGGLLPYAETVSKKYVWATMHLKAYHTPFLSLVCVTRWGTC